MQVTLKKSRLQIGELKRVVYDFSDNRYLISIPEDKEMEADARIEAFQSYKTNELIFSDIAEYIEK